MESTYNKSNTLKNMRINTRVVPQDQYKNFNAVPTNAGTDIIKGFQTNSVIVTGGGGVMGSGIADSCNRAGSETMPVDLRRDLLSNANKRTAKNQQGAAKARKLSYAQLVAIEAKKLRGDGVVFETKPPNLDDVPDKKTSVNQYLDVSLGTDTVPRKKFGSSKLYIEAIKEDLKLKQDQFGFYAYALEDDAILATNTSSLEIDKIAEKVPENLKHKVIGFHFFVPADRNPLVEIIVGKYTSIETLHGMLEYALAMGKTPIICWGDRPGAIANRILVGVLNEAAKIAHEGTDPNIVDKVFLETFYEKQAKVKTKKAQNMFAGAPKLGFFKDVKRLYGQIKECDELIKSKPQEKAKHLAKKKELLEEAFGELNQKVLYSTILENHATLGTFFHAPPSVLELKNKANEQVLKVRTALSELERPFEITPYEYPRSKGKVLSEEEISDRLKGAYIAIAQEIYLEGLGTPQDIELACKQGFYWNIGPLELASSLGNAEVIRLTNLVNKKLPSGEKTGISKLGVVVKLNGNELSGVQTYVQDRIGHIVMGRRHIQTLMQMENSLSREMLLALKDAVKQFESDPNVKSIFFESQGGGPFSQGADLNYVIDEIKWDTEKTKEYLELGYNIMMNDIRNCTKPTIAVLSGLAAGGGGELASACDYRIGSYESGVCFPEVNKVGIYPGWGGPETFPAIVGNLLAEAIMVPPIKKNGLVVLGAQDAYDAGFLDKLVLQSELPHLKTALIQEKVPGIDIYLKPPKKANQHKKLSEYTYNTVKSYGLDKLSSPKSRYFGRFVAKLTRKLIANPQYKPTPEELTKTLRSGWLNSKLFIEPLLALAQSKIARFLGK